MKQESKKNTANTKKESKEEELILCSIITEPGCEKFCAQELLIKYDIKSEEINAEKNKLFQKSTVNFNATKKQIIKIAYTSQTAKRVLINIANGEFDGSLEDFEEQLKEKLEKEKLEKILCMQQFRVNCERAGEHPFNSVNAEQITGIIIEKKLERLDLIDFKNPEIKLFLQIEDNSFSLGLDVAGKDLSKREYRVFNNPNSIKGTIAFSLLLFAGYTPGMKLIDPFALSGVIPIEASLYESGISVNFYNKNLDFIKIKYFSDIDVNKIMQDIDKKISSQPTQANIKAFDSAFPNVSAQKKNAKVAGTEKYISFSRTEAEWIDIKLEEKSVNIIASRIIEPSKHIADQKAEKIYKEFFGHIHYSLKKNAALVFILREPELMITEVKKLGYEIVETADLYQGMQELKFVKLIYANKKNKGE